MSSVTSSLYWAMPGPIAFRGKVSEASRRARAVFLSFPAEPIGKPLREVELALKNANILAPVVLNIYSGMNISAEIGTHFGRVNMTAQSLAHHRHGAPHAVVLNAIGERAQEHCEKYAAEFLQAIDHSGGSVLLVVALHDGKFDRDESGPNFCVIAFDGSLTQPEMSAYVAQRLVAYDGPGSTGLFRHLAAEYAGFDPTLAERLAEMDPGELMNLPQSLSAVLEENPVRWSKCAWVEGTQRASSAVDSHSLYEWYMATHSGPQSAHFRQLCERRYWRASLKALIPWLEERRSQIIKILDGPLTHVERAAGGPGKIAKKIGSNNTLVGRDDLEYNDLTYQSRTPEFNIDALTPEESLAVSICFAAKRVRDDISHLRKPDTAQINDLITSMDALLGTKG